MAFTDDVLRHADQIKARVPHIRGEEATKQALVVPLLQVLGYDVFDPREVQPEYVADFAKKKAGQFEKIDYAIWLNTKLALFIECKPIDADLADHDGQLSRYFNATPDVRVAALTNGVRFKVFCDLQQPNVMDPTPWLDVDLTNAKPAEIEALRRFRKVDFSADDLIALAEEMVYYNTMVPFLSSQLREPTESFVRYVAGEISAAGRVTQKVVERLTPILRKALQAAVVDHVAKSFERPVVEPVSTTPVADAIIVKSVDGKVPAPRPSSGPDGSGGEGKAGVVTTAEELACWEQIEAWIHEIYPGAPLDYRDSKSYFTIYQGSVRKWFLRLNATRTPGWLAFRHLAPEETRRLAPGLDITDAGQAGASRAMLKSLADLPKLRSAVIAAFDREAARVGEENESAVAEEAPTA